MTRQHFSVINFTIIGTIIGLCIIFWGLNNDGYIRIIFGLIILFVIIKSGIENFKYVTRINKVLEQLQGQTVFFYPSKKVIQDKIKELILPEINQDKFLQVYYDGPTLTGDINREAIKEIINRYKELDFNSPAFFKIIDAKIHIEYLNSLINIESEPVNLDEVKMKLDKIKNAGA